MWQILFSKAKSLTFYLGIIIILLIYLFSPARFSFNYYAVTIHGLYFLVSFSGYYIIKKLKVKLLDFAWCLITWGLLGHFLSGLFVQNYLEKLIFRDILIIIGLLVLPYELFQVFNKNKEYLNRYRSLFSDNHSVIMLINPENGKIIDANKAAFKFYKYSRNEFLTKNITEINTLSRENVQQEMNRAVKVKKRKFVFRHRINDGKIKDVEVYSGPITINGQTLLYSIVHDITDRKKAEAKLEFLSYHDQLTGLKNRRFFNEKLKQLNEQRITAISLIMIDIDRLKKVNDTYGHQQGDNLIKETARILSASTRKDDFIARIGGDEFVIIMLDTNEEATEKVIKRISEEYQEYKIGDIQMSLSMGYASKKKAATDLFELLKKADARMYLDKKQHKKSRANSAE